MIVAHRQGKPVAQRDQFVAGIESGQAETVTGGGDPGATRGADTTACQQLIRLLTPVVSARND
ncbi:hypothetical protein [Pantoea sp.]|uniref:hypothetical protein n=1 Tax=Pantoea sp. TaxID=69393 RepID=UPI0039E30E0F